MDPIIIGIIGIIALLILLVSGVHISVALGLTGIVGLVVLLGGIQPATSTSASLAFGKISDFSLEVIPLFVLMGFLAEYGGGSGSIYNSLRLWIGRLKGGLGIATVAGSTAFGTICGSSMVTAMLFAKISAPEMRRQGYEKKLAYAISASAGMIGMLIPPSILIAVYALMAQESVGELLVDGIVPGLMLFAFFSLTIFVIATVKPAAAPRSNIAVTWRERFGSLKSLIGVFVCVVVVFGGIFGGVFSPSEAGAVATIVLLAIFLLSKSRSWGGIWSSVSGTVSTTAMIFLILIAAGIFSRFLVLSTITPKFMALITDADISPILFLVIISIVYLILGCFLDSISMLTLTIPFLHPAAIALGINPLQFAMVAIIAMELGLITPPVGINVFAVKGVAEPDVSTEEIFRGSLPFFGVGVVTLALFIFFPALSTFLPSIMLK